MPHGRGTRRNGERSKADILKELSYRRLKRADACGQYALMHEVIFLLSGLPHRERSVVWSAVASAIFALSTDLDIDNTHWRCAGGGKIEGAMRAGWIAGLVKSEQDTEDD